MNIADIELAKMVYLASSLAIVLFTSMMLRGLWRPLRFVLLACAISIFFTPYFLTQKMPDGSEQNIVPAFVVTLHKVAENREHWRETLIATGKPIAVVGSITSVVALFLALLLPKPRQKTKPAPKEKTKKKKYGNPYLPEDFSSQQ
jgi:hypothetical protein